HLHVAVPGEFRHHDDLLPGHPAEGDLMATTTPTPVLVPRPFRWLRPVVTVPLDALEDLGEQLSFFGRALAWVPRALPAYWKEIVRLIAEVSLGTGALAVIAGSVGVIGFLTFFTGTEV